MDKGKQQKNTEKKSYYGVFDPKAHQEAFEASLDKVYEETHEAQQKLQKLKERYKTTQNISKAKAKRTNVKLAKKLDKIDDIPSDANQKYGSTYFMRYCSSCHKLQGDSRGEKSAAPPLGMIFGRYSGADLHYPRYSSAMNKANIIWTRKNLKEFMMNPKKMIPGTKCFIEEGKGVPREAEAWDIAEFLKRFTMVALVRFKGMGNQNIYQGDYQFSTDDIEDWKSQEQNQ